MVGRPCTVCSAPDRKAIEAALLSSNRTISDIARDHGLTRQALLRHRDGHLPVSQALQAMQAEGEVQPMLQGQVQTDSGSVLDEVRRLGRQAQQMMAKAYNTGDLRTANLFLETARRCLETQAKCLGQIETGTTVNLTVNDFRTLQVNIVAALAPFPEARAAVLRALGDDVPTIEG